MQFFFVFFEFFSCTYNNQEWEDDDDSSITYLQALELSTNFRRERRST